MVSSRLRGNTPNKVLQPPVHCVLRPVLQQKPEKNMKSASGFQGAVFFQKGVPKFPNRGCRGGVAEFASFQTGDVGGVRAHPDILRFGNREQ